MYINITKATHTDLEDRELIQSTDTEARDLIIDNIISGGEVKPIYYAVDDITDDYIELDIDDYFDEHELDIIEDMMYCCSGWTEHQVRYILDRFTVGD
jgi:hypothetical protein